MKHIALALVTFCLLGSQNFKAQNWAWINGNTSTGQSGNYGNIGIPAASNIPGARTGSSFWKDNTGQFWLHGGEGVDGIGNSGYLNDLWRLNPVSTHWTYIKGDNVIGQISVFGTQGNAASANKPSGRTGAAHWTDNNGNLWMFGGYGFDGTSGLGYINDLWKYDIASNMWTWHKGSTTVNAAAAYGTVGVSSSTNNPGGRKNAQTWVANNGDLYLFGGYGIGSGASFGSLNDLWKYDINTNTWTWLGGSNSADQFGVYGTLNTAAPSNQPGARAGASVWKDQSGNFWMLGGDGFDAATPTKSYLNDFWMYSTSTSMWTWKGGSNTVTQAGNYGTIGVASASNMPGCRVGGYTWIDANGFLWLFGGDGIGSVAASIGGLDDLWRYNVTTGQWTWIAGPSLVNLPSIYGSQNLASANNRVGGRNTGANWVDAGSNLWLFGGQGYATSASTNGKLNDLWRNANCLISPITMTIVAKDSSICAGESTSLTVSGSNNYIWAINSSTLDNIVITPSVTSVFSVTTQDSKGCTYTATFTEIVDACQNIVQQVAEQKLLFYPMPFRD